MRRSLFAVFAVVLAIGSSTVPVAAEGVDDGGRTGLGRVDGTRSVVDWNDQALETVRAERLGAFGAARVYAMVNVAMYDAVNGIDVARHRSRREAALIEADGAPRRGDRRAAVAAAAHGVLVGLFPGRVEIYDEQLASDLDAIRGDRRAIERGRAWGAHVGQAVVEARLDDGSSPGETLPGGTDPGRFRADWGSAQFRAMDPFGVADTAVFRSDGPPDLASAAYAEAFNEVKALGDGSIDDPDALATVRFWRGGGGSARPPGEWIKIAQVIAPDQRATRTSLSATVRLFALLGMALADSAATSADSKFTYTLWRPTTAINNADTDGNPATEADPGWVPRNGSIGGSPEHTSGQSTFAGAGSTILAGFYCRDRIRFTFTGDDAIDGARTYRRLSQAAEEAGRARILAGIHFEFSNQAGQEAGRALADEILDTRLGSGQPGRHHDCR